MTTFSQLAEALHREVPWSEEKSAPLTTLGFEEPSKAWGQLLQIRGQTGFPERYPRFFPRFLEYLQKSYDPDLALNNFLRLADTLNDKETLYSQLTARPGLLEALLVLFSGSQILSDTLLANPEYIDWLARPETLEKSKTRDVLYRDFYTLAGTDRLPPNTPSLLRRFKKREYIRIGLRDLMGRVSLAENVGSLSDLADVCLQVAYEFCIEQLKKTHGTPVFTDEDGTEHESEFAILSMGKLGGRELNYSSDIDLIYIYSSSHGETRPQGGQTGVRPVSNHEFHTKLGQMITRTIHEITPEGNVFRVDLDLRPEGRSGEIANSLTRCETYYQSWGRTWERQAMIKARVSAGSDSLGREFFEMITPFVYRRTLDFSAVQEIKALKGKVDEDLIRKKKEKGHIKLGAGGIREIEFTVQSYQLLFGGRDKSLREPNTLKTMAKLYDRNFLTEEEYKRLQAAYIFLRNLENRVQVSFGLQTYHLPREEKPLAVLARKMGFSGLNRAEQVRALMQAFEEHTAYVNTMYGNLFVEQEDKEGAERALREWDARRALESRFSPELMKGFEFSDPERAYRFLKSLRDGPAGLPPSERSIKLFYEVLPSILDFCARAPLPNMAVENLVKFMEASQARETFLELFHSNEKILDLFLTLFGSGEVLGSILIKQPNLMDVLMSPESLYRFKSPAQMRQDLGEDLEGCGDRTERNLILRRFKQAEELRIGTRYLIRETDLPGTLNDLSSLADSFLQAVLELAAEEVRAESGSGWEGIGSFAIFGMGKLGGNELNFGSDLDLIFVYDDPDEAGDAMTRYSLLSQKLYRFCSEVTPAGFAYKVDTDLRPEGSRGTLVLSLKGYEDYFQNRGRIWEQQAMTRARFVAGDPEIGRRFIQVAHAFTYRPKLEYGDLIEIARLRERMETELAQEARKGQNVKLGFGGLADIEFAVQIQQLMHGYRNPQIRQTNTLQALRLLSRIGLMDDAESARVQELYLFMRNLECGLRLLSERSANHLPGQADQRAALARMVGFDVPGVEALERELMGRYESVTREIRGYYRKTIDHLLRTAR